MNRCRRTLVYVVLFAAVPQAAFQLLPGSVGYHVVERYAFATARAGEALGLAVLLPTSGAYQRIERVEVAWTGEVAREPRGEVEALTLVGTSDRGGAREATVSYDVVLRHGVARWHAPIEDAHLRPQPNIESDAPELAAVAAEVCASDAGDAAFRLFAFTARHLSWPEGSRIGVEPSALAALHSGIGVCGEFANLLTALSRACGIPARSIAGLAMPSRQMLFTTASASWNHPGGAHAWTEVWVADRWTLGDPSWASDLPTARFWFGRSRGGYLSYGDVGEQERAYGELLAWAEAHGQVVGAMSAPLKFVAVAVDAGSRVTPTVTVQKTRDDRWVFAGVLLLASVVAAGVVERRAARRREAR